MKKVGIGIPVVVLKKSEPAIQDDSGCFKIEEPYDFINQFASIVDCVRYLKSKGHTTANAKAVTRSCKSETHEYCGFIIMYCTEYDSLVFESKQSTITDTIKITIPEKVETVQDFQINDSQYIKFKNVYSYFKFSLKAAYDKEMLIPVAVLVLLIIATATLI